MSALFTTYISPSVESMSIIDDMANMSHDEIKNRVLYAIASRGLGDRDIMAMTVYISEKTYVMKTALEQFRLFSFDYNNRYPTRKKGYVSCIEAAFGQVKSITAPLRVLIRQFRRPANGTQREREAAGLGREEALKTGYMTGAEYSDNLFPGEYPQCVCAFVSAVERYFSILDETLAMIGNILEGERALRNDPSRCRYLLNMCIDECRKYCSRFFSTRGKVKIMREEMLSDVDDSLYRQYAASTDKDKFITDNLHKWDDNDMRDFSLMLMLDDAESIDATLEEQRIFGDYHKILAARRIVAHFDALFLDTCPKNDVSLYVGLFCDWTGESLKRAHEYFTTLYHQCGGKHKIVKSRAVSDTKKRSCWNEKREVFRQKIASFLEGGEGGDAADAMVVCMQPGGATPLSKTQCSGGLPRN